MSSVLSETNGSLRASVQELLIEVAVLKSRLNDSREALKVQAVEYERRLVELNHAHDRAEQRDTQFVSREVHDRLQTTVMDRLGISDNRLTSIESKNSMMYAAVAVVVAIISLAVTTWRSFHLG